MFWQISTSKLLFKRWKTRLCFFEEVWYPPVLTRTGFLGRYPIIVVPILFPCVWCWSWSGRCWCIFPSWFNRLWCQLDRWFFVFRCILDKNSFLNPIALEFLVLWRNGQSWYTWGSLEQTRGRKMGRRRSMRLSSFYSAFSSIYWRGCFIWISWRWRRRQIRWTCLFISWWISWTITWPKNAISQ